MFGLAGGNEGAGVENPDEETERREEENTKESLRSLQGKVLAMRKERVPYEDVLCPSPSLKAYILEDGKLSTIPSARISPSQFISVLSDPTITSNLREIDVALGLWEDWGWDVEEEWSFEVRSRRRDLYAAPDRDEDLVAYVQRQLDLPILKRLLIKTLDVPVGVVLGKMQAALKHMEEIRFIVEGGGVKGEPLQKTSIPVMPVVRNSNRPTPMNARFRRDARCEKMGRRVKEKVERCLDGIGGILQGYSGVMDLRLPHGVEDVWVKSEEGD
ncbi:hypothetical protein NMY22_g15844 [Coprinellus aureogranulatus]|nr:hypothetical protein NMY22_g15844 [Coprinellus aureogranulatus]